MGYPLERSKLSLSMIPFHSAPYLELQRLLAEARLGRGFTQTEVARKLGVPQSFVSKYERGERRLDVIELWQILQALEMDIYDVLEPLGLGGYSTRTPSVLEHWKLTPSELTRLSDENPSLRGMLLGYVAELKLEQILLSEDEFDYLGKPDDHDRTKKGDHLIEYAGQQFMIESKSLQTSTVKKDGDTWLGKAQVDASDRRTVILDDGSEIETTLLKAGEFDILAVNCFAFTQNWDFVFAKNTDLPRSTFRRYPAETRNQLLASMVPVSWPPEPPFSSDLAGMLDELLQERINGDP